MEYKRFKEVVDDFVSLEDIRLSRHHRGDAATELKLIAGKALVDLELESLSLYKLLLTFQKIMERFEQQQNKPVHTIVKYGYTIETQQHYILDSIRTKERVDFAGLFESAENRIHALVTFLALLELLNLQQVQILQGEGINNFWVYPGAADGNNPEPAED